MTGRIEPPTLRDALRYWFKLGWISFGGPAGQIALMHEELVERRRWISEGRFLHALNYCTVLPGPEAQQLATYIGWLLHGTRGGIAAGLLFIAPSALIMMLLAGLYLVYGQLPVVAAVLQAVKPAVVAIVLAAATRIGSRTLRHPSHWLIAISAFLAISLLRVPFPWVILVAGLAGWIGGRLYPASVGGAGAGLPGGKPGDHVIGDSDPPPPHARFRLGRSLLVVALGGGLGWIACQTIIAGFSGNGVTGLDLAWFHTKAALLTFGGAYAVLPYVFTTAVDHYQWLTPAQMIDGLALGETTPGPLIIIVTFVGFVAGWTTQFVGVDMVWMSAVSGALIATFFTFLPSFVFILAGAPFIEGTRHQVGLRAPLNGITAAVVGVIVSLALFFAGHVFITPQQHFDWRAIAVAAIALVLLTRWKVGVLTTLALAATFGGLWWYLDMPHPPS